MPGEHSKYVWLKKHFQVIWIIGSNLTVHLAGLEALQRFFQYTCFLRGNYSEGQHLVITFLPVGFIFKVSSAA